MCMSLYKPYVGINLPRLQESTVILSVQVQTTCLNFSLENLVCMNEWGNLDISIICFKLVPHSYKPSLLMLKWEGPHIPVHNAGSKSILESCHLISIFSLSIVFLHYSHSGLYSFLQWNFSKSCLIHHKTGFTWDWHLLRSSGRFGWSEEIRMKI